MRLAVNKHELFARAMLGDVHTWDQTKLLFIRHQWIEDKRKTNKGGDGGAVSSRVRDQSVQRPELHDVEDKNSGRLEELGKEFWRSDGGHVENPGGGGHGSRRGELPKGDVAGLFGAGGASTGTSADATTGRTASYGAPTGRGET